MGLRSNYKVPLVTHISVDEVYARKKHQEGETRNDRFFTIVTCVKTKKVVWVSDFRRKEGLDGFYKLIGPKACSNIKVVAQDMIAGYYGSPVTSALSEGINNVVKTIKRRAYGYRNMDYFKLKIMQVCGLLNSNYMKIQANQESMA